METSLKILSGCLVVLAILVGPIRAADSYMPLEELGPLQKVERAGNAVILHARFGSVRVNFVTDSVARVFVDPYGRFEDRPSAQAIFDGAKYQAAIPVQIEESPTQILMKSDALQVTIEKNQPIRFSFAGADGNRLTRTVKPLLVGGLHSDYHRVRFEIASDEQFYGLGERFYSFNHRGRDITLWNVDAINQPRDYNYYSIPFFLGSRGYGIFYNNTWQTRFRFGSEHPDELSFESPGPNCDFFFIYGPTPKKILDEYLNLTGHPPLLPRYALGLWMGDFPYDNQARVPRIGQEFIDHQLPWDNFYLDYEWANMYFDFKFHPQTTPNPEKLGEWFREHHRQLALIETPFTNAECPLYGEALDKGFFVDPEGAWWHTLTRSGQVDFSNRAAAHWWWQLHEPAMKMGVTFFVTDDGEFTRAKARAADGSTGSELHNYYALLYARGMFEEMEKSSNRRGFICSRSGFAGSQKFGSFFAGDQDTEYRNLQKVTRAVLSSSLSGMPLLRTDLAGLFGQLDPARYARFVESQALHSMLMLFTYIPGSVTDASAPKLDRRPWVYGEETLRTFRKYLQLRHSLVPYFYTLAEEAHASGTPMVRPLLYAYPRDQQSWGIEDEYLVGPEILVAPVMTENTTTREVYLPAGDDWVDYWSDHLYPGGQKIPYDAPVDVLPLLVRRGAILPFQDPLLTNSDHPHPELTWRVYPSSRAEKFVLYEDDSISQDYKQGKATRTEVSCQGETRFEIRVRASTHRDRKHTFEVHLLGAPPKTVSIGEKKVKILAAQKTAPAAGAYASWDAARKLLLIVLPELPAEETVIRAL
jgi:alpha-glucosidase (family GH31 glycosyl hydrolase)